MLSHPIAPVYDAASRVLILGSFPSARSREAGFYYAHPRNRFWPVLAAALGEPVPGTEAEKRSLLLRRGVALWDVIARCEVRGSSDASIRREEANDLGVILRAAEIRAIFCNGGTAARCYRRHCLGATGREAVPLPSTSPANARWTLDALTARWREALAPWVF